MGVFSVDDACNIFRHQIVIFLIQLFEKPRAVKFCIAEGRVKKCEILPCEWYFLGWCSSDAFSVGLPPAWVDDAEEIAVNIQRARVKMAELVIFWRWQTRSTHDRDSYI